MTLSGKSWENLSNLPLWRHTVIPSTIYSVFVLFLMAINQDGMVTLDPNSKRILKTLHMATRIQILLRVEDLKYHTKSCTSSIFCRGTDVWWGFSAVAEVCTPSTPGDFCVDCFRTNTMTPPKKRRHRCDFTIKLKLKVVVKVNVIKV